MLVSFASPNASAATKQKTGKVNVNALTRQCRTSIISKVKCSYYKSKSDLIVADGSYAATGSPNVGAKCNGKKLNGAPFGKVNLGKSRKVVCTPGFYSFKLESAKDFPEKKILSEQTIEIKSSSKHSVRLGSAN